ncbi:MAG TPA: T9SS type A sorting domain-containing protein, partial [Bacteroidia bacterium]|nr:T9SS type A sorting domain-containing protein [Bacteroidia bacterium]
YAWAPNVSSGTTASNLTAGNYIVTVTDSAKCTTKDTVKITQPVQIQTTAHVVTSSCKAPTGSVGITASAGVTPYTYSWTPGGQTTDSITGLAAGIYTCNVTDANGCKVTVQSIVSDSTTLKVSLVNSVNVKCYGQSNGLAAFSVTGGSGLKDTYSWSPSGGTGTSVSGVVAGTYTFTVTDSLGCQAINTITITQPAAIRDSMANVRQVACFGASTGRLTDGIKGGTGPYSYSWSNGSTASNITNIPAGSYSVMTTDANGCMDSAKITITQPATAVADSNKGLTIACYGGTTTATVYPYGGTPGYTYTWSTAGSNTTSSVSGLKAGTYVVQIRDSNKCRLRDTLVITQAASFIQSADTSLVWSTPCSDNAWVVLTGGTAGYTFSWSPSGGTHDTASGLCPGNYTVTITNTGTGCVEKDSVIVGTVIGVQQYTNDHSIKVYPNPANTNLNISISGASFIPQNVMVYDITGREVISQSISANSTLITLDVTKLAEGNYLLKLIGNNGNKIVKFSVSGR